MKTIAVAAVVAGIAFYAGAGQKTSFALKDAAIVKCKVEKTGALFNIQKAAEDLVTVVSNITGRAPAVYAQGKEPAQGTFIYLGDCPAAAEAGVTAEGLRLCDWRVKCVPGKAFVCCRLGVRGEMPRLPRPLP